MILKKTTQEIYFNLFLGVLTSREITCTRVFYSFGMSYLPHYFSSRGGRKEGNVLFNDAFYLRLYGVRHMRKDDWDSERGNPLPPHGILFPTGGGGGGGEGAQLYAHIHCFISFPIVARVLLYAPSYRQDNTYHSLCYTSHGALTGTRNSSMGPPWRT